MQLNEEFLNEYKKMEELIEKCNNAYYNLDDPIMSDYEYVMLNIKFRQYRDALKIKSKEKIGGKNKDVFKEVSHDVKMQSLNDVFTKDEVKDFIDKLTKEYGRMQYVVEVKIDGLSVSLEYKNGKLEVGSTRGNGSVGENVTDNLKTIKTIPHSLSKNINFEVRGEVYLAKEELKRINEKLVLENKKELANPRNAAAGTLRQLDTKLVADRNLDIFIFNVQKSDIKFQTHSESLDYCKKLGFKTIEYSYICEDAKDIFDAIDKIEDIRYGLKYDIDGAVIKVNNLHLRDEIGVTEKVPKWAVAYKYPPMQQETKILDIICQVGRTGKVTPMAVFDPVKVSGSIISKATLHNFEYIKEKDIEIGDYCIIHKAGDVIPEVEKVVLDKRKDTKKYITPTTCPSCGSKLVKDEEQVDLRCKNKNCPGVLYRSMLHFVTSDCMDIVGFGEMTTQKLIEMEKIKDFSDIYYLTYEDLMKIPNFQYRTINRLLKQIDKSKSNSIEKLIFGLGIKNVGKKIAKILSVNFKDMYELAKASKEDLLKIEEFGNVIATNIYEYFRDENNYRMIEKFEKAGVNIKGSVKDIKSNRLEGKVFCITGTFDNLSRDDIEKYIESHLGKTVKSVTKKLSYLVSGMSSGSKLQKAQELNIPVISLDDLYNM